MDILDDYDKKNYQQIILSKIKSNTKLTKDEIVFGIMPN